MKTYLHFCIYHEHNSLKMYWNENLSNKFVQKRDAHILCSINIDKDAVCRQFCSTCTANALPRKLWMGLETSTSEGKLFKL